MKATLKTIGAVLALATLAGCGAKTKDGEATPTPAPFSLDTVSPDDIKANFDGDLHLTGTGFLQGATVLVDGAPVSSLPGFTMTIVDDYTIALHIAYQGAGAELPAGDYTVQVEQGTDVTATRPVHVRPILAKLDHVRTLPGLLLRNGGFLDIWVKPTDSEGDFMGPGEELAGATGLGDLNFRWENVKLTPAGQQTGFTPDVAGVADVTFEPVGTTKPLAVSITIDQSGSMIGLGSNPVPSDPNDERITQSQAFVDRMGPMDQATVIRFQGEAGQVFTVKPLTGDKAGLKTALDGLRTTEGGNTPLFDAMIKSVNDVKAAAGTVTKAVIVLTDGRDTTSTQTKAQVISAARAAGVPIYSIGLGNPNDPNSLDRQGLQDIADQTGGRVFFAADSTALAGIFDQLSVLLTDSYRLESAISFDPPLTTAGTYTVQGDLFCDVDGEELSIPMPSFNVSILN